MPTFTYRVKNKDGNMIEGLVEGETAGIAGEILGERGLEVISLAEKKKSLLSFDISFGAKVSIKDLAILARQLSVLISAKMPLVRSLRNLVKQTSNKRLKVVLAEIADQVEGGMKLSESLGKYPKIFSAFFVNIVRSGENSGRLEEVLNYLADQMEKDYELNSKIKGALIYPAFIVSGMIILGIVMMVFVIPKLTEMLVQTGAELPLSTRILIGLSNFMRGYWWLLLIIIVGGIVAFRFWLKTKAGRKSFDRLKLSMPVFGKLLQYIYIVRFTRSLRTLEMGGVDLVTGLDISSRVVGNETYKTLIVQTKEEVEDGGSVATVFNESKLVPAMLPQMMATGEETGKMDEVLDKIAAFYTREISTIVDNLMSLLEPVIMVILGVAVGIMVAAVVLPMYNLSSTL